MSTPMPMHTLTPTTNTLILLQLRTGYNWILLIPGLLLDLPNNPPTRLYTIIHIQSTRTGYTSLAEEATDFTSLIEQMERYEEICAMPGGTDTEVKRSIEKVKAAVENAVTQGDKRWVSVFMRGMVELGWGVDEEVKRRVERGMDCGPFECGYGYA
ncbi:hypothetical protein BJX61DRAFT_542290 [Aspergillus egyptiacus]|nr:hypothetical protein BJX61DRAFT_542290 [Aspergillus egyptiacus]